jgi:hypothetical protein
MQKDKNVIYTTFDTFENIKRKNMLGSYKWNALWSKIIKTSCVNKCLEKCMYGEDTFSWLLTYNIKNISIK